MPKRTGTPRKLKQKLVKMSKADIIKLNQMAKTFSPPPMPPRTEQHMTAARGNADKQLEHDLSSLLGGYGPRYYALPGYTLAAYLMKCLEALRVTGICAHQIKPEPTHELGLGLRRVLQDLENGDPVEAESTLDLMLSVILADAGSVSPSVVKDLQKIRDEVNMGSVEQTENLVIAMLRGL